MNNFFSIIQAATCLLVLFFLTNTVLTNDIQEKQLSLLWVCVNMLNFLISFNINNYDER